MNYTRPVLESRSHKQLDNMLEKIRVNLNNKSMEKFYESVATSTAIISEQIITPFYDIEGFSDTLLKNDQFWDVYEKWRIEHTAPALSTEMQMLYIVTQTAFIQHELNKNTKHRNPVKKDYEMKGPDVSVLAGLEKSDKKEAKSKVKGEVKSGMTL